MLGLFVMKYYFSAKGEGKKITNATEQFQMSFIREH